MEMEPFYKGTKIEEPPTLHGNTGDAWRLRLPPPGQRRNKDADGTVGTFIVQAPGRHPLWDHWVVSVIHLRPIEGVKPATITKPGATHEFLIMAINPMEALPSLDVVGDWTVDFLRPLDAVVQFTAESDAIADLILEAAVGAIVHSGASPDQDYRWWWEQTVTATAKHYAAGIHPVPRPS